MVCVLYWCGGCSGFPNRTKFDGLVMTGIPYVTTTEIIKIACIFQKNFCNICTSFQLFILYLRLIYVCKVCVHLLACERVDIFP